MDREKVAVAKNRTRLPILDVFTVRKRTTRPPSPKAIVEPTSSAAATGRRSAAATSSAPASGRGSRSGAAARGRGYSVAAAGGHGPHCNYNNWYKWWFRNYRKGLCCNNFTQLQSLCFEK
ncbi:hypothetical protein C5167_012911 [Papaver somniferum]|uniref:Uncharacterized protein n=1 Tax=Papaver somniferum TaxID=3469 RepID=A0A4Y7J2U5_PAPSO|nr:hypothetical protein C5167_012911 [Papaver somniferum]